MQFSTWKIPICFFFTSLFYTNQNSAIQYRSWCNLDSKTSHHFEIRSHHCAMLRSFPSSIASRGTASSPLSPERTGFPCLSRCRERSNHPGNQFIGRNVCHGNTIPVPGLSSRKQGGRPSNSDLMEMKYDAVDYDMK